MGGLLGVGDMIDGAWCMTAFVVRPFVGLDRVGLTGGWRVKKYVINTVGVDIPTYPRLIFGIEKKKRQFTRNSNITRTQPIFIQVDVRNKSK